MSTATATRPVTIGTQFRSPIADSNALWEVTAKIGRGVWEAVVLNEPMEIHGTMIDSDYVGTTRSFRTSDIQASVGMADLFTRLGNESDEWWEAQEIGSTVHYHNSFGAYVRGEVVLDEDGRKAMRHTALVGEWRSLDLPRRYPDGTVHEPYHVEHVRNGTVSRPNASSMHGNPKFVGPRGTGQAIDPATLTPLVIDLPEMTEAEQETARLYGTRNAVIEALNDARPEGVAAALDKAADILSAR